LWIGGFKPFLWVFENDSAEGKEGLMAVFGKRLVLMLALILGPLLLGLARADEVQDVIKAWMADTANQGTIPPGTKITMQNWQQIQTVHAGRDDRSL
jgi:hypothetical protein